MSRIRTIFMGTPDFALPCLDALVNKVDLISIVTQPDRPKGRGHKLQPSPVKLWAIEHNLPVLQPESVKAPECIEELAALKPDLIVVVAFGQILPQSLLDLPKYGCVNVHASLLPRYRGAAPIEWAIINGETETGVTTMQMNAGLDTGDMLVTRKVDIPDDMILPELRSKLQVLGADALIETVDRILDGSLVPVKQDDSLSNYAPMLTKQTGLIDWNKPAQDIHNLVRGLYGGAYAVINDVKYKIYRTRVVDTKLGVGEVVQDSGRIIIGAADSALEVLEIQAPNSKMMSAADFLRGRRI